MGHPRVLLILFDGAEWNVIEPLIAKGRMPNLSAFMRAGSYGRLRSLDGVALASPLLWTSMATGKLPEKHGLKDFFDTASSVRCARIWEIFEREGLPIGLFRYLITWPPRPTNGFIVPDWCARTPETYPPELEFINTMKKAKDWRSLVRNGSLALSHGARVGTLLRGAKEALRERFVGQRLRVYFRQRWVELALHADIFLHLVRRYRPYFATFYAGLPDATHHQYWKFMEPEKFPDVSGKDIARYGRVIPDTYEEVDRRLGTLLRVAGPETLVVIASDHGGEALVDEEYRWAEVRGESLIRFLGLNGAARTYRIGMRTYLRVPGKPAPFGSIGEVAEALRNVRSAASAAPIFLVKTDGDCDLNIEAEYIKEPIERMRLCFPDGREVPAGELLNITPTISGNHSMEGVLLMCGPDVKRNTEIEGASLLDVVPTVLALLGRPVGRDMDGKVLTAAIEPELLARNPVSYIGSYDALLGKSAQAEDKDTDVGLEEVKERLRALGYIE